jgi:diguanylate cyclase (GGDEF)-like protein
LLLDLNGLKDVNDKFGHAAGDELIRRFAEYLSKAIRGSDLAVRTGGDEFLVLLPECKLEDVHHILNRLNDRKLEFSGQSMPINFSAGWANFMPGESSEDLLKRADDALYVNKRSSKERNLPRVVTS